MIPAADPAPAATTASPGVRDARADHHPAPLAAGPRRPRTVVLALQRSAGNRAVAKIVARQVIGRAGHIGLARQEKPTDPADSEVLQWPVLLGAAGRAAGQALSVHLPDPAATGQTQAVPTLTNESTGGILSTPDTGLSGADSARRAQAQRIVSAIARNRQQIDAGFLTLGFPYYHGVANGVHPAVGPLPSRR